LAEIAIELNKQEKALTGSFGMNDNNLDMSGNFNIQVLMLALQQIGDWRV